ncbi:MAG: agmatine deiminase family protein [Candidatus Omnitrophota bacterium]|nr:MAG: agmatine deiminase family protein [Candidatus Omnitrophota bacterium]
MPAEWEIHAATWIAWPHNRTDWPGKFVPIQWVYAEITRCLADSELVRILVKSEEHQSRAEKILAKIACNRANVEFVPIPTNRSWTRDYGPIFLKKNEQKAIIHFKFNAWAKYPDWKLDNQVAPTVAALDNLDLLEAKVNGMDFVLEGGAIDLNGEGTVITSEECLLDEQTQVRNPGFQREQYEQALRQFLGVRQVIWLEKGIGGDDTHGHVDDFCRFVNPHTVVLCREPNPKDDNYHSLQENRERLENLRLANGKRLEVIPMPLPAPVYFDNVRLPASYANFYIANEAVLVPTFNDPNDRVALGILAELFPNRTIVGIHAGDLIWGLGAIHCLTQQQPA